MRAKDPLVKEEHHVGGKEYSTMIDLLVVWKNNFFIVILRVACD